jgi:hypothetical protein
MNVKIYIVVFWNGTNCLKLQGQNMEATGRLGGVVVSMLAIGPKVACSNPVKVIKNPQHIFFRMGSKAGGPMSKDFTAC